MWQILMHVCCLSFRVNINNMSISDVVAVVVIIMAVAYLNHI